MAVEVERDSGRAGGEEAPRGRERAAIRLAPSQTRKDLKEDRSFASFASFARDHSRRLRSLLLEKASEVARGGKQAPWGLPAGLGFGSTDWRSTDYHGSRGS